MQSRPQILFAHAVYDLAKEFVRQGGANPSRSVRSRDEMLPALAETDVLVISGLWTDTILDHAPRLKLIQSVSAGVDQYPRAELARRGIRLCSGQGVNANAVSDHAMALVLALSRQLHVALRDQASGSWAGMIADPMARQAELDGKSMVILGLGRIGSRLARLAQAFGMTVTGVRRTPGADTETLAVAPPSELKRLAAEADVLALTCPLTPETEGVINAEVIGAMKRSAYLVNVARGRVVDEVALTTALRHGRLAGAGLDCFHTEPMDPASPLWALPNVIVTPHSAGETQHYERNVVRLLLTNLQALGTKRDFTNLVI